MVMPGTEAGSPERNAAWRAMLVPDEPSCMAQPRTTSSISSPLIPARCAAWAIACAASYWGWVLL